MRFGIYRKPVTERIPVRCTLHEKRQQLLALVLADGVENNRWPTYLFSETANNEDSVMRRGVRMMNDGSAEMLYIIDDTTRTNSGYPGADTWKKKLSGLVLTTDVETIPCKEPLNTFTESLAVASLAKERNWNALYIVAPSFHQMRAFISMVSAMKKLNAPVRVYNKVGMAQPWGDTVAHSQGTLVRTRLELVVEESRRIETYTAKGDLLPIEEVLQYIEWRDTP